MSDKPTRFFGLLCAHEWQVKAESVITRRSDDSCVGMVAILRCKHCGDHKEHRTRV